MRPIDADALKKRYTMVTKRYSGGIMECPAVLLESIDSAPTIDAVEVVHGEWLWLDGVRCSRCNYKLATTGLPSYCPNCGALMMERSRR